MTPLDLFTARYDPLGRVQGRRSGFGLELPWGERSGARKLAATRAVS